MNDVEIQERIAALQDEVTYQETAPKVDTEALENAQKWVEKDKLGYAEAIIALHEFKQQHGL